MSKEQIDLQIYEQHGPYHRKGLKLPFGPARMRYDLSLALLPEVMPSKLVLDFGGGDGAMSTLLADRGAIVTLFDPIRIALEFAKDADYRLKLIQGKTHLPFPNDSFDFVTMLETLEHIPDSDEMAALKEINRVLKPSGSLVLSVPSLLVNVPEKHYRHYNLTDLRDKLCLAGLDLKNIIPWKWLKFSLNGSNLVPKLIKGVIYGVDWVWHKNDMSRSLFNCREDEALGYIIRAEKNPDPDRSRDGGRIDFHINQITPKILLTTKTLKQNSYLQLDGE